MQEYLAGVAGLALLRLSYSDDALARSARLADLRDLLGEPSDAGAPDRPSAGQEFGLQDGYAEWSATYDQPLRLFAIEEPHVLHRLDELPAGRVLDVACGTGRYGAHLQQRGHRVVGVDRSADMLGLARPKLPGCGLIRGDAGALPFVDRGFDAVLCTLALVHVVDLGATFAEFARVLRPGGRLIISDVHPVLVTLGWQAQFSANGEPGFIRLEQHRLSDYIGAAIAAGFGVGSCDEPSLTLDGARTAAAGPMPDANREAFVGLPALLVFDFVRRDA
jgi:SAM-dependent methyltransferase